jgi:hypothetical protein
MANAVYDRHGIRFEYPQDWELDVTEEGPLLTVEVVSPGGLAFALLTVDDDRPAASKLTDEALAALREEYPGLDASPALESIAGHRAVGHDVEFLSLDLTNSCVLRSFRTPRRTVFYLGQWSDLEGDDAGEALAEIRRTIAETDA